MATATANKPVDMDNLPVWETQAFTVLEADHIREMGASGQRADYYGTGFAGNEEVGITGGTLQGVEYRLDDVLQYSVTGLSHSLAAAYAYWDTFDNDGLAAFLFSGSDTLNGSSGADVLNGYVGHDKMHGNGGHDMVRGNGGNDQLWGNAGNDTLGGAAGNDQLWGGAGHDTMTGGTGSDKFIFNGTTAAAANSDVIKDFVTGSDDIQLDDAMFAGIGATGALGDARFFSGHEATAGSADTLACRLIYDETSGKLFYDADGMGGNAGVLIAKLAGGPELLFSDVQVI